MFKFVHAAFDHWLKCSPMDWIQCTKLRSSALSFQLNEKIHLILISDCVKFCISFCLCTMFRIEKTLIFLLSLSATRMFNRKSFCPFRKKKVFLHYEIVRMNVEDALIYCVCETVRIHRNGFGPLWFEWIQIPGKEQSIQSSTQITWNI